jgi:hypothetical protein
MAESFVFRNKWNRITLSVDSPDKDGEIEICLNDREHCEWITKDQALALANYLISIA